MTYPRNCGNRSSVLQVGCMVRESNIESRSYSSVLNAPNLVLCLRDYLKTNGHGLGVVPLNVHWLCDIGILFQY